MSTPTLISVAELTDAVKGAATVSTEFAERIHATAVEISSATAAFATCTTYAESGANGWTDHRRSGAGQKPKTP